MVSIEDLPEHILVDVLIQVPAQELICNCRLVCSRWRDLVDWPVLWRRKFRQKGKDLQAKEQDAKYIFCHLEKNLVKNPCGEEGLDFWEVRIPEGGQWLVKDMPNEDSVHFPDFLLRNNHMDDCPSHQVNKCFAACNGVCIKSQLITLKEYGYWDQLLEETNPTIMVKDWFYYTPGCCYQMNVELLSKDFTILQEFSTQDWYEYDMKQVGKSQWREVSFGFYHCCGVHHILFEQKAHNQNQEQMENDVRITHSSVTIGQFFSKESPSSSRSGATSSSLSLWSNFSPLSPLSSSLSPPSQLG